MNDAAYWESRDKIAAVREKQFAECREENKRLRALNAQMLDALKGAVRIADRAAVELELTRAVIAKAERSLT